MHLLTCDLQIDNVALSILMRVTCTDFGSADVAQQLPQFNLRSEKKRPRHEGLHVTRVVEVRHKVCDQEHPSRRQHVE